MDQHSPSRYPSPDIARIDASCEIAYPRSPERIKVDPGTQRFSSNPNTLSPGSSTCVKTNTLSPHYNNPNNNQNSFNNNQQPTNTFNNSTNPSGTSYNQNQSNNQQQQQSSSTPGSTGILFTKNTSYSNSNQLQPGSYNSNQLQPNSYSNTNQLAPPSNNFNQSTNQLSPNLYNQNSNQLSPGGFGTNQLSPMQNSPSYYQGQPVSPNSYPRTPSPQAFPLSAQFYNEISSSLLTNVVSQPHFKAALEQILKEKLAERKDFDNTLKRLWIFQHLIETPCQKCCFINNDPNDVPDGNVRHKFRIKSKCLANHFRVSGNTPFNWLVRDFCRVHAPHSAGVNERKDLREIYYDEFGLFNFEMTTNDFIVLAQRLSGRPTTSSKKRKRKNSGGSSSSSMLLLPNYESPPSKVPKFDFGMSLNESTDGTTIPKFEPAETPRPESPQPSELNISSPIPLTRQNTCGNKSRLVLSLVVSNSTNIIMVGQKINQPWQKTLGPLELPTFRPELSPTYFVGRKDKDIENEEQDNPYKLYIDDPSISRTHLLFTVNRYGWQVIDQGSSLGTVITTTEINGENEVKQVSTTLRPHENRILQQGDIISLSDGIAVFTVLYHKFCPTDVF